MNKITNPLFQSSGNVDIDAIRQEVMTSPTTQENYRQRSLLLYMWLSALQQQGANTRPFTEVDKRFYDLTENQIPKAPDSQRLLFGELTALIDEGFNIMENIQIHLVEHGPIAVPQEGNGANFPEGGDMKAE